MGINKTKLQKDEDETLFVLIGKLIKKSFWNRTYKMIEEDESNTEETIPLKDAGLKIIKILALKLIEAA